MKTKTIVFIVIGVLILIGLAYYFLIYKPSKASEKSGSGTPSGSGAGNGGGGGDSGCVPYTQAQQDADMQKCASDCSKKTPMQQMGCMVACNTHKKPVKTC